MRYRHSKFLLPLLFLSLSDYTWALDFKTEEFGSLYYAQSLSTDLRPATFQNSAPDFTDFSLVGMNLNVTMDDHWSAGAQLVATGDPDSITGKFTPFASWATLGYTFDDGTIIKIGRQRFPIFTASEYIYVHQALPYRTIPDIVFRSAQFAAFDGISIGRGFDVNIANFNVSVFGGTPVLEITPPTPTTQLTNLVGARVNLDGDGWRVRAQASRFTTTNALGAGNKADQEVYSLGYRYDKYNIVSWGEYALRHSANGTPGPAGFRFLGLAKTGYILAGYRIGSFMPRYTFAQTTSALGLLVGSGKTTSHTIGLNFVASKNVTIKAQYEIDVVPVPKGGFRVTQPAVTGATSGSSFFIGADFLI